MFARCRSNHVPPMRGIERTGSTEYPELEIGRCYNVYGLHYDSRSGISFLVGEDPPYSAPAELFDIADARISRHWYYEQGILEMFPPEYGTVLRACAGYREYVVDPEHVLGVVEARPGHLRIFREWKRILDMEFPHPDITDSAGVLGENWVQCPFCADGWEVEPANGMTECTGCGKLLRNPLYIAVHRDSRAP